MDVLKPDSLRRSLYSMLTQKQREKFEEDLELDFSHALVGEARFRVNIYRQRDSTGAAFRVIPYEIKPLEALGIPPVVSGFAQLAAWPGAGHRPHGIGKVDDAGVPRGRREPVAQRPHRDRRGPDRVPAPSQAVAGQPARGGFGHALVPDWRLRHVLRQDPDIILIGEMRDLETIQVALTAAETGHLVFATLHTQDSAQTIDRIIDVFPSGQQGQIRTQLATALQGIVCQTLLRRQDGPGRAAAAEVLVATPAIRNLIREGKTHQIYTALQAGANLGMQTMDQHLADLVKRSVVSYEAALELCHSVEEFKRLSGKQARDGRRSHGRCQEVRLFGPGRPGQSPEGLDRGLLGGGGRQSTSGDEALAHLDL